MLSEGQEIGEIMEFLAGSGFSAFGIIRLICQRELILLKGSGGKLKMI
jgi:hypothetical protein